MKTDNVIVFVVDDNLQNTISVFVFGDVSSAVFKSEGFNSCINSLFFYSFRGFTYRSNLGIGIDYCGDRIVIDSVFFTKNVVYTNFTLTICGVKFV